MKALKMTALTVLIATSPAMALAMDFELSLTNESAKGQLNFTGPQSDINVASGYTYHEGRRHILNVDFHAKGRTAIGNLPTTAGIGVQGIGWDQEKLDGGAVGIGGYAVINFPEVPGLSFRAAGHFAPSILSFGDSDDMASFETSINYRVIRNAEIFGGYRYLETELELPRTPDLTLDEGVMGGIRLYF